MASNIKFVRTGIWRRGFVVIPWDYRRSKRRRGDGQRAKTFGDAMKIVRKSGARGDHVVVGSRGQVFEHESVFMY